MERPEFLSPFERRLLSEFQTESEFWNCVFTIIQNSRSGLLSDKGLTAGIIAFREKLTKSGKGNLVLKSLFNGLFAVFVANKEINLSRLFFENTCGTTASLIVAIRQMMFMDGTSLTMLPTRGALQKMTTRAHHDFITTFDPRRTPTGFRLDLIKSVQFLLKVLFGVQEIDLKGVHVDIYGDAMAKGKKDVVRFILRVWISDDPTQSDAQSSSHTFCFAAFKGKDSRANLELNLGSSTHLGSPGWLYEQTEYLRKNGAKVTATGDSQFFMHLVTEFKSDNTSAPSKCPMFIQEVSELKVIELEERMTNQHNAAEKLKEDKRKAREKNVNEDKTKKKKKTKAEEYDPRKDDPVVWKKEMLSLGAIFPDTVDPTTGRRTRLKPDKEDTFLNDTLNAHSLISLDSMMCVCPDPLHMMVRIVENIIKNTAQYLSNEDCVNSRTRLEDNLTKRDVKSPRFQFEVSESTKTVGKVSFSGSDATVIIAHPDELKGADNPASLFDGVYNITARVNFHRNSTVTDAENVFAALHPLMKHPADEVSEDGYFLLKELAEANLESLNQCFKMLRGREAWDETKLEKYKDAVDSFYASTNLLFSGEAKLDFTPYMIKLDVMWRLQMSGHISHIWFHLGEAGEKSHHRASGIYHTKTMRDGGHDARHFDSQFTDLYHSYIGIGKLAIETGKVKNYDDLENICRSIYINPPPKKTYLEICREVPSRAALEIGKTNAPFRGIVMCAAGLFSADVTYENKNVSLTHTILQKMIVSMGGSFYTKVLSQGMDVESHGYFCVVPSQEILEKLVSQCGTRANIKFENCTMGPWKYVTHAFVTESYKNQRLIIPKLLDPKRNTTKIFRKRKHVNMSRLLSRQEKLFESAKHTISAISAYKKNKKEKQDIAGTKQKKRRTSRLDTTGSRVFYNSKNASFRGFRQSLFAKEKKETQTQRNACMNDDMTRSSGAEMTFREKHITVRQIFPMKSTHELNRLASSKWSIMSKAEQDKY